MEYEKKITDVKIKINKNKKVKLKVAKKLLCESYRESHDCGKKCYILTSSYLNPQVERIVINLKDITRIGIVHIYKDKVFGRNPLIRQYYMIKVNGEKIYLNEEYFRIIAEYIEEEWLNEIECI